MTRVVVVVVLMIAVVSGCSAQPSTPGPVRDAESVHRAGPAASEVVTSHDPYIGLAQMLGARQVDVWFETDLVAPWLKGPAAFDATITRIGRLAKVPGVVGFKVADELGYGDGLGSPDEVKQFLVDVDRALKRVAPSAQLLVDAIVPELGCLPWKGTAQADCASSARSDYPAATEAAMTSYLRSGAIDRLDLSTGLLDQSTYDSWGTNRRQAQVEAWAHVARSDWPSLTTMQARKALAEAGGYSGSGAQAADDVATYVDVPVAAGARAVDIWTWRQTYDGQVVSLLDENLSSNPLWQALEAEHRRGVPLITHMTPSAMPTRPHAYAHECDRVADVFTAVFVAAGTG